MAKPRVNTVGSFVKHGETLTFSLEQVEGVDRARWACSCGERGGWLRTDTTWRSTLFRRWRAHVESAHPDFTLDATVEE